MCLTEEIVWKYIVRYVAANCCVLANTTRESGIYPWLDFSYVPRIFAPYKWGHLYRLEPPHSTNVPSQGRVGASSNPPGTNVSHLYRTHLYRVDTPRYKCDICIGQPNHPVQASLLAPSQFSKSSPPSYLLFYSVFPFLPHSPSLIYFFVLHSSHISLDLPCRAPGGGERPAGGARDCKESDARYPKRGRGWIRQLKTLTYGFTKFTQS
jgi:hypothetical protein